MVVQSGLFFRTGLLQGHKFLHLDLADKQTGNEKRGDWSSTGSYNLEHRCGGWGNPPDHQEQTKRNSRP